VALDLVVAGTGTVAAVVALFGVPFVLGSLMAMLVRADACVLPAVIVAGLMIAYIWVFESGGWFDFRPAMTIGVVLQFGLWCAGVWAGHRIRARRARLRGAPISTA
jgi:hypothetical protein